ncbi:uncharacterized protein LOC117910323 [Vitis riparia]|uniref:uncharacterized protein LOC117910323 n=1 Tax=Vitis riparia TaxID=96939 RepID=UPI00155B3777|nr:uncharacterized protein LOC117910323 [Vitis riparia]
MWNIIFETWSIMHGSKAKNNTIPPAWSDDLIKKRVHAELQDYGDFGLSDVQEDKRGEDAHEDPTNPVDKVEEETSDEIIAEYNAAERQIHQLLRTMRGTIDKLAKQHNTNKTPSPSHQRGSHNQPDINESFPSPPHGSKLRMNFRRMLLFLTRLDILHYVHIDYVNVLLPYNYHTWYNHQSNFQCLHL